MEKYSYIVPVIVMVLILEQTSAAEKHTGSERAATSHQTPAGHQAIDICARNSRASERLQARRPQTQWKSLHQETPGKRTGSNRFGASLCSQRNTSIHVAEQLKQAATVVHDSRRVLRS